MAKQSGTRKVVVYDEYMDGMSSLTVRKPMEFDDEYRLVPVAALDEYEAAWEAWRAAEVRLGQAYAAAKVVRCRKRASSSESGLTTENP